MRKKLQIMGAFAAVGLLLPWLIVLGFLIARRLGVYPDATNFLYVCPSLFWLMATDGAPLLGTLEVLLLVGVANAILYSLVGALVALVSMFVPRRN